MNRDPWGRAGPALPRGSEREQSRGLVSPASRRRTNEPRKAELLGVVLPGERRRGARRAAGSASANERRFGLSRAAGADWCSEPNPWRLPPLGGRPTTPVDRVHRRFFRLEVLCPSPQAPMREPGQRRVAPDRWTLRAQPLVGMRQTRPPPRHSAPPPKCVHHCAQTEPSSTGRDTAACPSRAVSSLTEAEAPQRPLSTMPEAPFKGPRHLGAAAPRGASVSRSPICAETLPPLWQSREDPLQRQNAPDGQGYPASEPRGQERTPAPPETPPPWRLLNVGTEMCRMEAPPKGSGTQTSRAT